MHQGPQHGQHPVAMPDRAVSQLLHRALPRPARPRPARVQGPGIEIEQAGGERCPQGFAHRSGFWQACRISRISRASTWASTLAVRQIDGGDGKACQLLLHQLALGAGAHQHGDIPGPDRLAAEHRLALPGQREQAMDPRRRGAGHPALVLPPC